MLQIKLEPNTLMFIERKVLRLSFHISPCRRWRDAALPPDTCTMAGYHDITSCLILENISIFSLAFQRKTWGTFQSWLQITWCKTWRLCIYSLFFLFSSYEFISTGSGSEYSDRGKRRLNRREGGEYYLRWIPSICLFSPLDWYMHYVSDLGNITFALPFYSLYYLRMHVHILSKHCIENI